MFATLQTDSPAFTVYIVLPEDDVLVVADVFGVFGFAAEVVEPVLVFTELPPLTINCCPG
ncbi:hypothetical protein CU017_2813 [Enterococcus lactis]|nr:hypothetical protein [Enterococcus lactis]